jgi:hypothetical protein
MRACLWIGEERMPQVGVSAMQIQNRGGREEFRGHKCRHETTFSRATDSTNSAGGCEAGSCGPTSTSTRPPSSRTHEQFPCSPTAIETNRQYRDEPTSRLTDSQTNVHHSSDYCPARERQPVFAVNRTAPATTLSFQCLDALGAACLCGLLRLHALA